MVAPVVELSGLGVRIGDTPILRDLDLVVGRGEAVGLHGANGSGKTTLLRVLATLLTPTSGSGRVLGADLAGPSRYDIRPRIAIVGHQAALYPELSLEENTAFVARVRGLGPERVAEVLDQVGLGGARHRRTSEASHGMQRRAEFARVLLLDPDLLLLDEAHAGLDPYAADLVALLAKRAQARGGGAVLVSHDPGRLDGLVDRAFELAGGALTPLTDPA